MLLPGLGIQMLFDKINLPYSSQKYVGHGARKIETIEVKISSPRLSQNAIAFPNGGTYHLD